MYLQFPRYYNPQLGHKITCSCTHGSLTLPLVCKRLGNARLRVAGPITPTLTGLSFKLQLWGITTPNTPDLGYVAKIWVAMSGDYTSGNVKHAGFVPAPQVV